MLIEDANTEGITAFFCHGENVDGKPTDASLNFYDLSKKAAICPLLNHWDEPGSLPLYRQQWRRMGKDGKGGMPQKQKKCYSCLQPRDFNDWMGWLSG
ncbi:MAG TPA: hypothetical protein VLA60_10420, partial [Nitrospirales bacterium]|nr:hypothetical protein [Nitrospirales bacterium]